MYNSFDVLPAPDMLGFPGQMSPLERPSDPGGLMALTALGSFYDDFLCDRTGKIQVPHQPPSKQFPAEVLQLNMDPALVDGRYHQSALWIYPDRSALVVSQTLETTPSWTVLPVVLALAGDLTCNDIFAKTAPNQPRSAAVALLLKAACAWVDILWASPTLAKPGTIPQPGQPSAWPSCFPVDRVSQAQRDLLQLRLNLALRLVMAKSHPHLSRLSAQIHSARQMPGGIFPAIIRCSPRCTSGRYSAHHRPAVERIIQEVVFKTKGLAPDGLIAQHSVSDSEGRNSLQRVLLASALQDKPLSAHERLHLQSDFPQISWDC
jgi:hypothetical protein